MYTEIASPLLVANPLLSVWVITYNHEQYIENAILSIINQKITVPYEIVISDDCSVDRTTEICKQLQRSYPNSIRLIVHSKNNGYEKNFWNTFSFCRGPYIAMLEGDDYWCENRNIEKQLASLENNPAISGVCGNFYIKDEEKNSFLPYYTELPWGKELLPVEDLLKVWTIHINTLIFKREMLNLSELTQETKCADIALAILLAEKAPIHYNTELYAVWRKHSKGFSNSLTRDMKTILRHKKTYLNFFNKRYNYKYDTTIRAQKQWDYQEWFNLLKVDSNIQQSVNIIRSAVLKEWYKLPRSLKGKLVYLFPLVYKRYYKIREIARKS